MELKLAEYKDGKFKRFLELGTRIDNFGFCGEEIIIFDTDCKEYDFFSFKKDEKDPLNRFNGLFHGRTYGEGRFVLIECENYIPRE